MTETYTIPAHADDAEFLEEWGVVRAVYIDLRARGFRLRHDPTLIKIFGHRKIDWPTPPCPALDQMSEGPLQNAAIAQPVASQSGEAGRA